MEQAYVCDPDVINLAAGGPYDTLETSEWNALRAVQNSACSEIPNLPYDWMAAPPVRRPGATGVWWLGNLLYPELYDYDMVCVAQEFYKTFWHYDLSETEAQQMLARSTLNQKVDQ